MAEDSVTLVLQPPGRNLKQDTKQDPEKEKEKAAVLIHRVQVSELTSRTYSVVVRLIR